MLRSGLFALAITAIMLGAVSPARAADSDARREVRDRAEIEQLAWRYARALDTLNGEAYAQLYAEDGQFGTGAKAVKGRAALTKFINGLKQDAAAREAKGEPKTPPMYHMVMNSYLEFLDKDHARLHAYEMTVFAPSGPGVKVNIGAAGRTVDELVRTSEGWRIKVRDIAPQQD